MVVSPERLADLLVDPRESLDFEAKNWLDLQDSNDDKATFAKAVLALANHGGGFIAIGFEETEHGLVESAGRPATLNRYNQDLINGIVQNYCDPPFHCAVHIVANPTSALFPIVVVPGGHRVPVRARRAGPNGNTVHNNAIYVRKPGPRSEIPLTTPEWDDLLARCFRNRRDEMFDQIRDLITGAVPRAEQPVEPDHLAEWVRSSRQRWDGLVAALPVDAPPRLPHGRYQIAYQIAGERKAIAPGKLPEILMASVVRHTGWPPFWYPTRHDIAPYPIDGAVECWMGPDQREPGHADFWRINPDGFAFLLRGYQEDGMRAEVHGIGDVKPGTSFDVTLPVWRVSEALLHAQSLANNLFEGPTTIKFVVQYEGLTNRALVSIGNQRLLFGDRICHQDTITLDTHIDAQTIDANLPEIVHPLLSPLYSLFDFHELSRQLVVEEITRMRAGR